MKRDEVVGLIRKIVTIYQTTKTENLSDMADAWTWLLKEYTAEEAEKAFMDYVKENTTPYPPKAPQIVKIIDRNRKRKYWDDLAEELKG